VVGIDTQVSTKDIFTTVRYLSVTERSKDFDRLRWRVRKISLPVTGNAVNEFAAVVKGKIPILKLVVESPPKGKIPLEDREIWMRAQNGA
jgi:hypothetical protein